MRIPRLLTASASAVALVVLLAGCTGASTASTAAQSPTPLLSSVSPLADPGSWKGATSARIGSEAIDAVTSGKQKLPATIADSQGTTVTVTDTSRILALDLYGSLSRAVFELGLGKNVVGRDISSDFAEVADRPLVTENGHDLNAEAILALDPTVIITDTSLGPWDTILQMRDAGVPVVVVDSKRSIDTIGSLIGSVADALGVPARGTELTTRITARVTAKVAEIAAVAPADTADRLRMVFLYVRGQAGVYYMFGEGSGADSLIDSLGGVDVAKEIGWKGMRPVTDEGIISAAPDLILVMTKGLESVGGVDGLLDSIPALAQTPAGENRRVVDMADTEILSFGPDTARVLDALAVAVYAPKAAE
ncbi:hemin ABC transporter substrate-binding protein [soil metagenome]